jgi:hypothetical protein
VSHGRRWRLYDATEAAARRRKPASAPVTAQDAPVGPGPQPDAPKPPQTAPDGFPDVQGRCPACGGSSLFVGSGGYITCSRLECPEPDAATTLLERNPRTTPVNAATGGDTADNPLRELQEMYRQQSAANAAYRLQIDELIRRNSEYANRGISNGQRADRLAATLRQALDAFEAYWARASYCGPGETAVQPEHLQAWRAVLDGKETP